VERRRQRQMCIRDRFNAFDLNQSQTLFVNAQSEVVRTKYDYIFRVKVIEYYFGIPIIK
jgi:outer membrane protein